MWCPSPDATETWNRCVHTYIHTYIHTCTHTYIRTYIHNYIHRCLWADGQTDRQTRIIQTYMGKYIPIMYCMYVYLVYRTKHKMRTWHTPAALQNPTFAIQCRRPVKPVANVAVKNREMANLSFNAIAFLFRFYKSSSYSRSLRQSQRTEETRRTVSAHEGPKFDLGSV